MEKEVMMCNAFDKGMLSDSIKLMDGKYGGGFYINYQFSSNSGKGFLQMIFLYPDGEIHAIPLCKNVCKEIVNEEFADGVGNVKGVLPKEALLPLKPTKLPDIIPHILNSLSYGDYDAFQKYERPDYPIPMKVLWSRIIELWHSIPIVKCCESFSYEEVYRELIEVGEEKVATNEALKDSTCVFLTREEIEKVADDMGYSFLIIRNVFERRRLWKKDSNTMGYQYSKKIAGKSIRFYALKKVIPEKNYNAPNEEFSIAYADTLGK